MRYVILQHPDQKPADHIFLTNTGNPINRNALLRLIKRLAKNAHVSNASVHRFRHTFAIFFLRNGRNVYALQKILGHTTLDMVKRYL